MDAATILCFVTDDGAVLNGGGAASADEEPATSWRAAAFGDILGDGAAGDGIDSDKAGQSPANGIGARAAISREGAALHGDGSFKTEDAAAMGSPPAKMLTRLIAQAIDKSGIRRHPDADPKAPFDPDDRLANSPLAQHYLDARRRYAERDWTEAHRNNASLRLVGKEMLRDLYNAAL